MEELTVKEFLEIKRRICPKRIHCIKCEFVYGCNQIANATDSNLDKVIEIANKYKEAMKGG